MHRNVFISNIPQINNWGDDLKKGQAATEWIGTYGWALVVILIVLGTFNYLYFNRWAGGTDSCIIESGFDCSEFKFSETDTLVYLQNGHGYKIDVGAGAILSCSGHEDLVATAGSGELKNTKKMALVFGPLTDAEQASCTLHVRYKKTDGKFWKETEGQLKAYNIDYVAGGPGGPAPEDCVTPGDQDGDGCDDDTDSDCGISEVSLDPTCDNLNDDNCNGQTDCGDASCDSVCNPPDLCWNAVIDPPESDVGDGSSVSDCGRDGSDCILCAFGRACNGDTDCVYNKCCVCDFTNDKCASSSPVVFKQLCPTGCHYP